MMYHPRVVTPPVTEPCSLAEVKDWFRLSDETDYDTTITSLITAAREMFENDLGYTFYQTTLLFTFDWWPCNRVLELPRATPLQSVESLVYVDQDGVETTWDASNYRVDPYSTPGKIYLPRSVSWPSVVLDEFNGIRVTYVAGKVTESPEIPFPEVIKQAMRLIMGHWNENREATTIGTLMESAALVYGVKECLSHFQRPNCF